MVREESTVIIGWTLQVREVLEAVGLYGVRNGSVYAVVVGAVGKVKNWV